MKKLHKLRLNRETLRSLSRVTLNNVHGGDPGAFAPVAPSVAPCQALLAIDTQSPEKGCH